MVYIGVDLHRKVSHVVALDEAGATILSRRFDHSREAFRRVFGVADLLADAGIEAARGVDRATRGPRAPPAGPDARIPRPDPLPAQLPGPRDLRGRGDPGASIRSVRAQGPSNARDPDPAAGCCRSLRIGILNAATIVAEIGDVTRFPSADHLALGAGLTPTERSSADYVRRGHISKQGSRWLRWAMVEAAARIGSSRAAKLRRFADPIADRRGTKIARVALARRILTLVFYALRDERGCRDYPALPRPSRRPVTARSRSVMASPDGRSLD